ncbi:MAG: hypothetical protein ABSE86_04945 [Bryobacteraceae bacterium]|jgi:hypothetical protein
MSKGREIRCFDYVNHPYEQVRDALVADAPTVFQAATKAAASRAQSVASELRVNIGGIGLATDINISVQKIEEKMSELAGIPITRLQIEWEAANMASLFPFMKAELDIYSLTSTETQLDFFGVYEAPLGPVGQALNAMVGHSIAEAAVHRFVNDIASYLREALSNT